MLGMILNPAVRYICVLALVCAATSCAASDLALKSKSRIDILERRIIVLERHKFRALADIKEEVFLFKKKTVLDIQNLEELQRGYKEKLAGLQTEIELINSKDKLSREKIKHSAAKMARLNKRLGDQEIILNELRSFFKSGVDKLSSASPSEQRTDFEKAFNFYKAGRLQKAGEEFLNFWSKYPSSALSGDCLFFIAYIHFLQGQYSEASLRFFEILEQFPRSDKADEAKWWLAVTLERSGDLNGALDLYGQLVKLNKKSPFANKSIARLNELKSVTPRE